MLPSEQDNTTDKNTTDKNNDQIDNKTKTKTNAEKNDKKPKKSALERLQQTAAANNIELDDSKSDQEDDNKDNDNDEITELDGVSLDDLPEDVADQIRAGKKLTKDQKKIVDKTRKKNEKESNRAAIEMGNQEKIRKEETRNEIYRKKEEEREKIRLLKEEEAAKKLEEEKKKAEEVLDEWKQFISVENQGSFEEDVAAESQGLLGEFVDYIKTKKVVLLEDLAANFNLRTQDVVRRINSLEEAGVITGVNDDRGKYIYITPEEFERVAVFIEKSGRIKIEDFVAKSNELIKLK